jgi:hypothetical protein
MAVDTCHDCRGRVRPWPRPVDGVPRRTDQTRHLAAYWSDPGIDVGSALCPVGELSFKPLYHAEQRRSVFRARPSVFRAEVGERFLHGSAPACVKEVVHDKGTCCLGPKGNSAFVKNLFVVLKGEGDRRQTGYPQALEEKECSCQSLANATRTLPKRLSSRSSTATLSGSRRATRQARGNLFRETKVDWARANAE